VIDVSICISSYRRPRGLLRLLRSLARLDAASPTHEIIVADNDAGRSAEPVVQQARAEGIAVAYVVQPVRGIAQARNRSVAAARGTFVAFIDDDEEAEARWLVELHGELMRHGADAAVGPILPRFEGPVPGWLVEGGFFDRPRSPTGTLLDRRGVRTGNALIRREMLMALPGPFDERYGLTGGEDTDMFLRLMANGARIVAVDSAIVWEHLPPHRTKITYLLRRRFLIGMNAARFDADKGRPPVRTRAQVRSLWAGVKLAVSGVILYPRSRADGLTRLAYAARTLGQIAFHRGFIYEAYDDNAFR
jgi:succinoglycan biosynthesis protein ExoM